MTDWNRDIPWLGAWLPMCLGFGVVWGILRVVGVPERAASFIVGVLAIGLLLYLWGPNGRLGRLRKPSDRSGPRDDDDPPLAP